MITSVDDLRGMLPDEILAVVQAANTRAEQAERELKCERERNAPLRARIKEIQEAADKRIGPLQSSVDYFRNLWSEAAKMLVEPYPGEPGEKGWTIHPSMLMCAAWGVRTAERDALKEQLQQAEQRAAALETALAIEYRELLADIERITANMPPARRDQYINCERLIRMRTLLAASGGAAPAEQAAPDVTPKTRCRCGHLRKTHGLEAAGARCTACECWKFRPERQQPPAAAPAEQAGGSE